LLETQNSHAGYAIAMGCSAHFEKLEKMNC